MIELLVVMGIIALLVGILLPVLGAARGTAKVTVCASQLRQLGIGWQAYWADHDGCSPPSQVAGLPSYNMTWYYGGLHPSQSNLVEGDPYQNRKNRPLNPYVGSALTDEKVAAAYRCPDDQAVTRKNGQPWISGDYTLFEWFGTNYPLTGLIQVRDPSTNQFTRSFKIASVASPSEAVWSGDPTIYWYRPLPVTNPDAPFHDNAQGANVLFLDGRVTYETLEP